MSPLTARGAPAAGATVDDLARTGGLELLRFAYLLCGDRQRAEDLLQDVLLAMYRRFPDGLPLDNPVGYARRALANADVSRTRRAGSRELVTASFPDRAGPVEPDPGERDQLWRALRTLPERQRTAVVLRYYADATDADIAAALGYRPGTVRSLLSRGLATLRTDRPSPTEPTHERRLRSEQKRRARGARH